MRVVALSTFHHNGRYDKGAVYDFPDMTATALAAKGLVEILNVDTKKNIEQSSPVSPAGAASQKTTAKPSGNGGSQTAKKTKNAK